MQPLACSSKWRRCLNTSFEIPQKRLVHHMVAVFIQYLVSCVECCRRNETSTCFLFSRCSLSEHNSPIRSEQEFIHRSDSLPRLESQLRKSRASSKALDTLHDVPPKVPVPHDLGGEAWNWPEPASSGPKIAFTVTTAESVDQIRLWLAYHRAIGVSLFYLFVEGQAGTLEAQAALRKEHGVTVIPNDSVLQERHSKSRIWNENWLSAFFNKPCNHELFVKQSLNMEMGIQLARNQSADWILHIDTDELMYPGGTRDYSLQELLGAVPDDVDVLVFPNYESLAESISVEDPFVEVTLFKRSYSHVQSESYFKHYAAVARGNPNYFTTYGNGKSAARIRPGLRPNGAHRWHSYVKSPVEWSSEQAAVLHFTYNRFSDLKSRRDRCDCKPTSEDAEKCFILQFDRLAFLEASLKDDEKLMEFFKARLVWDDSEEVGLLVHEGLFVRLYAPQVMIRGLREAMGLENKTLPEVRAPAGTKSGSEGKNGREAKTPSTSESTGEEDSGEKNVFEKKVAEQEATAANEDSSNTEQGGVKPRPTSASDSDQNDNTGVT
jgi:hypothetical protein